MFPAGQTALQTNLVTELSDAKGRVTFGKLASYEAVNFMIQSYASMRNEVIPLNVQPSRASITATTGIVMSCDASVSSTAASPTICIYSAAASSLTNASMSLLAMNASNYMLPFIEYLGTI